ncbi:hypothetical protein IGX65_004984 [Escherichia coli]|nr:hypothetical protein [Escherichia coli]EHK7080553.1 hypothetical protein [Escherichia coli]
MSRLLFQRKSDLFFGIAGLFHDGMTSLFDERKTGYFSLDWYYFQGRGQLLTDEKAITLFT